MAIPADVPAIVRMLADDPLGRQWEDFREPLPAAYYRAFEIIDADPNQELMVVEDEKEGIIGTLQISYLQYLTFGGGTRAQIGAVRIRKDHRGKGIGRQMFAWTVQRTRERGVHLLQLLTHKDRQEAACFYEHLGFLTSHEGMTLSIGD